MVGGLGGAVPAAGCLAGGEVVAAGALGGDGVDPVLPGVAVVAEAETDTGPGDAGEGPAAG